MGRGLPSCPVCTKASPGHPAAPLFCITISGLCCVCLQAKEAAGAERPALGHRRPGREPDPEQDPGRMQQQHSGPRLLPWLQQLSHHLRPPDRTAHISVLPTETPLCATMVPVSPLMTSDAERALSLELGSPGSGPRCQTDSLRGFGQPCPSCACFLHLPKG